MVSFPTQLLGGQRAAIGGDDASATRLTPAECTSANSKGLYVELFSATPFAASGFYLSTGIVTGTQNVPHRIDIAIGSEGSEIVILPDLCLMTGSISHLGENVYIPLFVPEGARLSARVQSGSSNETVDIAVTLVSVSMGFRSFSHAKAFGLAGAGSGAIALTDPASEDTKATYTEYSASLSHPIYHMILAFCYYETSEQRFFVDVAIGAGGSEHVLLPNVYAHNSSQADMPTPRFASLPIYIPAGSRLAARHQAGIGSNDVTLNLALYGFY